MESYLFSDHFDLVTPDGKITIDQKKFFDCSRLLKSSSRTSPLLLSALKSIPSSLFLILKAPSLNSDSMPLLSPSNSIARPTLPESLFNSKRSDRSLRSCFRSSPPAPTSANYLPRTTADASAILNISPGCLDAPIETALPCSL